MIEYLKNLLDLFIDMSFYMVIGLIFTGILHAFIKKEIILKHIGKDSVGSVVKASVLGVPLPLCSCGVVPTAMHLGESGASKGSVVSFLTSTPQTGVDSLIATYGMLGPLFAIYRAVAAFISGIVSGIATNILCRKDEINYKIEGGSSCCCSHDDEEQAVEEHSCCCSHEAEEQVVEEHSCCCSHEAEEKEVEEHSCCCSHEVEKQVVEEHSCCSSKVDNKNKVGNNTSFLKRLKIVFTYAFGEFLDKIASRFVVGLLIAALISTLLPTSVLTYFKNPIVTMILMVLIGIPMYICSTASIPIAVSLIMKGISPGAAFVFLFAGPLTNIASLSIVVKTLGKKVTAIYLASASICAIAFGLLLDYIINLINYRGLDNIVSQSHIHETPIYMIIVAIIFGGLVIKSLIKKAIKNK